MKKRFVTLAVLAIVLLVLVGSASAVTWGSPDNGQHPYVGTLLFSRSDGYWYSCSGTLLNADTVLTAGHCTSGNLETYFMNAEDVLATRQGQDLKQWLRHDWAEGTAIPHPQYTNFSEFPATYDVGVVKLKKGIDLGGNYGQLPQQGLLETLVGQAKKNAFSVVGYGMQGYINPFESDIWARYKGNVSLIELNSTNNGGQSAKFTNNPGGGNGSGGSCYGDSGGPVFYGSGPQVVAVVSWGITPCIGVDYQFRVDTETALTFINQHLN